MRLQRVIHTYVILIDINIDLAKYFIIICWTRQKIVSFRYNTNNIPNMVDYIPINDTHSRHDETRGGIIR